MDCKRHRIFWILVVVFCLLLPPGIYWAVSISNFSLSKIFRAGISGSSPIIFAIAFLIYAYKTPKSNRSNDELAKLENLHEVTSKKIIIKHLGIFTYLKLNPNIFPMNTSQTDLCEKLLKQDNVEKDNDLKFYIYLKLYKFFFIDEDYYKAINALKSALIVNPNDIIVNIWMAEAYEHTANAVNAIVSYETSMESNMASADLKESLASQIERIKTKGTQKIGMAGFRYMAY